jgi:ABC-type multidrug transport system ATPase subunit
VEEASSKDSAKTITMMISLSNAGKRYNRDWIFRHLTYQFKTGNTYAITGPNGSGKTTLLQTLAGMLHLNEGNCEWKTISNTIEPEKVYRYISFSGPYLELIEELTLKEFLEFHQGFKSFLPGLTIDQIAEIVGLGKALHKQIRYYSSGMKQRLKLAQCILTNSEAILLDEPCTNLDAEGVSLYHQLIADYGKGRMIIVSSNDKIEYDFCNTVINIIDFK